MLDRLIEDAFDQMAGSDQPPARVSVAQAIRQARVRRWQRLAGAGTPVLAAGAALAIMLGGLAGSGPDSTLPGTPSFAAPAAFNPLRPYVAAGWYPYRVGSLSGQDWLTVVHLNSVQQGRRFVGPGWTSIAVYAAGQCALAGSRLSCGSAASSTGSVLTVAGRAPDVGRHAGYWIRRTAGGEVSPDIPAGTRMVAFQYARDGWAMVTSTGTAADVIKTASNLRYGQTARIRFPFRLTALPSAWRKVRYVGYNANGPGRPWAGNDLILGPVPGPGLAPRPGSVFLLVGLGSRTRRPCFRGQSCRVINGDQVILGTYPAQHGSPVRYGLQAPDADGLFVDMSILGPHPAMTPAKVFAHHLKLFGPNPAAWTTRPISP